MERNAGSFYEKNIGAPLHIIQGGYMKGYYEEIGAIIGAIVDEKDAAYGNSIECSAKVFRIWFPNGIRPEQYDDILILVRILDKMTRIANKKHAFGENPYVDIAGYGMRKCRKDFLPERKGEKS